MSSSEESEEEKTHGTRESSRQDVEESFSNKWKIPVIITLIVLVSIFISVLHYYSPRSPMECYYCTWISRPDGPLLADDPCGQDQRLVGNNGTVKTCGTDQPFCGVLHLSFSYKSPSSQENSSPGKLQRLEYAFVRDCFTEYPLPYVVQFGGQNQTYHGWRAGAVYPDFAGKRGLNLTIVGQECTSWSRCNSNVPREGWAASFLDSITIIQKAKMTGLSVWQSLVDFVNPADTPAYPQ